jgi:hypothetical protein
MLHSNWRSPADTPSLSPTVVAGLCVRYSRQRSSPETFCVRKICLWTDLLVMSGVREPVSDERRSWTDFFSVERRSWTDFFSDERSSWTEVPLSFIHPYKQFGRYLDVLDQMRARTHARAHTHNSLVYNPALRVFVRVPGALLTGSYKITSITQACY